MKKLLFSILLMSGLLLSFGMAASAAEYTVTTEDELFAVPYETDKKPVIEIIGDIVIDDGIPYNTSDGEHITLKGSGALIFADDPYLDVGGFGTLTLAGNVRIYTVDGLAVNWGTATLVLKDNASVICEDPNNFAINAYNGKLTISGNASVSGGKYGVYATGAGTIEMTGGSVSGSEAGVFIKNLYGNTKSFTMSGGSVSGGSCGVDINVGEFNMNGGSVSGNKTGVLTKDNAVFTMTGGSISGCGASGLINNATAKINGGLIYNNANQNGGADIENHGSLELGAAALGEKLSCGHKIDGWYDDSPGARWSCESYTPVETGTYTGDK